MPLPIFGPKNKQQADVGAPLVEDYSDDTDVDWDAPQYAQQEHILVRGDVGNIDSNDPYEDQDDAATFYADSDEIAEAASPPMARQTIEQANPADVYTRPQAKLRTIHNKFQMWSLPTNSAPMQIAAKNARRTRILLWTDATNPAGGTGISDDANGQGTPGGSSILLAAGSGVLELHTTGDLYMFNPTAGTVTLYTVQEINGE